MLTYFTSYFLCKRNHIGAFCCNFNSLFSIITTCKTLNTFSYMSDIHSGDVGHYDPQFLNRSHVKRVKVKQCNRLFTQWQTEGIKLHFIVHFFYFPVFKNVSVTLKEASILMPVTKLLFICEEIKNRVGENISGKIK